MKCPNCGSIDLLDVGDDVFKCDDCGSEVKIRYLVCKKCFCSIRLKNDKFFDIIELAPDAIDLLNNDLSELDDYVEIEDNGNNEHASMSDLIDNCLRCGNPVIREGNVYICPNCNFSWETI